MRILIDGCDGTGKTTIAEKLANEYGCNIIRLTYGGDRSLKAYFQMMAVDNVVHDRTFISEIIYPKYFARASKLEFNSEKYLWNMIENLSMRPFILTASSLTIKERILQRGDEYIKDVDKFGRINRDYITYAHEYDIPLINTTDKTVDEIIKEIGGYLT